MIKAILISALSLCVTTLTIGASVSAASEAAVVSQGHHFALLVCAACHVVAADQQAPPILRTPGPSFDAIANKPGTTAASLKAFLATTHATIAIAGMPNPQLADYQMDETISYILSLRRKE